MGKKNAFDAFEDLNEADLASVGGGLGNNVVVKEIDRIEAFLSENKSAFPKAESAGFQKVLRSIEALEKQLKKQ